MRKVSKSREKQEILMRAGVFLLGVVICLSLGIIIGQTGSILSIQGSVYGSFCSCFGSLLAFFILKIIFPVRGEKTTVSYLVGSITIIIGICAYIAWGFFFISNSSLTGFLFVYFIITGIIWLIIMILMGLELPVFLAMLLGAVFGSIFYAGFLLVFPGYLGELLQDSYLTSGTAQTVRLVYGLLGAFIGAIGSSILRASGFDIREPYLIEEL